MKRFIKTALSTVIFAFAAQAFAVDTTTTNGTTNGTMPTPSTTNTVVTMTPAEQAQIEEIVHQYLLKKPEVLMEALQVLQKKQYEEAEQTVKKTQADANKFADALLHTSTDPVAGNPNGKVTVVEFFDYQCPHCIDMAPVTAAIIKANPDVKVVFKEFPIRGPMSELASRAALAANKQGKYYEFSHALLTTKKPISKDVIVEIANTNKLNVDQLLKDMDSSAVNAQLQDTRTLAQNLKLFGTPAFFIAKSDTTASKGTINYVPGQMDQKQMQTEIDKAAKS